MHGKVIQRLIDLMVSNKIIKSEETELYSYGLMQGTLMLLNIFTILIIGKILGMLWQSSVFMVTYFPLRTYAGGYHARTQLNCYISSVVLIVMVLLGIRYMKWTNLIYITISIISGLTIYIFSPVEDSNKPIDDIGLKIFRKKSRIILIFELILLILFIFLRKNNIAECILVSLFTVSVMLILGKIKCRLETNSSI
jgi:accessory gene regulator B